MSTSVQCLCERVLAVECNKVITSDAAKLLRQELGISNRFSQFYKEMVTRALNEGVDSTHYVILIATVFVDLPEKARAHFFKSISTFNMHEKTLVSILCQMRDVFRYEDIRMLCNLLGQFDEKLLFQLLNECIIPARVTGTLTGNEFSELIRVVLPYILPSFYSKNSETRSAVQNVILSLTFQSLSFASLAAFQEIVKVILVSLVSPSPDFQGGAILAAAFILRVVDKTSTNYADLLATVLETDIDSSPQVFKAMVKFLRIQLFEFTTLSESVSGRILDFICKKLITASFAKGSYRVLVRRLLSKYGKKYGYPVLLKNVDAEMAPLIRYVDKMSRREKKKKHRISGESSDETEEEEENMMKSLIVSMTKKTNPPKGKLNVMDVPEKKSLSDLKRKKMSRAESSRPAARSKKGHEVLGTSVSSAKTGDAKRKNQKLAPFAYVRLNPSLSREKNRKLAIQSFRKVISKKN
jgi:hypothetical protein